jgi:membrane protease YdiL (CAAX protease family)
VLKNYLYKLNDSKIKVLVLFICSLLIFNLTFISTGGWARLAWNTLGYLILFITYKAANLNLSSIGLSKNKITSGLKFGFFVIGIIATAMLIIFFVDKTVFQDTRYRQDLLTAIYSVAVFLPLKTVLFEEITFRGILPAIALKVKDEQRFAAMLSSILFGCWHIFSASKIGNYPVGNYFVIPNIFVMLGVFVATSLAGLLLYWLRVKSDSLVAPILVHWFINAFGIMLAYLALQ